MESEMIKCKNGGCPNGKEVCCFFCEEKDTCKQSCDSAALSDPAKCEEAIIEGDALELFRCESALALSIIENLEVQKKALDEQQKKMREVVKDSMEKYGITKFANEIMTITYTKATQRNSIDSKALKADLPDIAKKYTKSSPVAASIRVKLNEK